MRQKLKLLRTERITVHDSLRLEKKWKLEEYWDGSEKMLNVSDVVTGGNAVLNVGTKVR